MTLAERLQVLQEHEWAWKEDLKTRYCATCGAQTKSEKRLRHRKGCLYQIFIDEVTAEQIAYELLDKEILGK